MLWFFQVSYISVSLLRLNSLYPTKCLLAHVWEFGILGKNKYIWPPYLFKVSGHTFNLRLHCIKNSVCAYVSTVTEIQLIPRHHWARRGIFWRKFSPPAKTRLSLGRVKWVKWRKICIESDGGYFGGNLPLRIRTCMTWKIWRNWLSVQSFVW